MMKRREVLLAAAMQGTIDSGTAATITITAPEDGIVDLSRLSVLIQDDDAAQATGTGAVMLNITEIARLLSLNVDGAVLYVRGENTPAPPLGIFGVDRIRNFVGLPQLRVKTGTTITLSVIYIQTGTDGRGSACVPFAPDRLAGMGDEGVMDGSDEVYVGSPEVTITAVDGTATPITVTFDAPGVVDLSRLVVKCSALLTQVLSADGYDAKALNNVPVFIQQILLSGAGYNMVIGNGTAVQAPNVFAWNRSMNLGGNLGILRVSPQQTLIVTVGLFDTGVLLDNASASVGLPMKLDRSPGGTAARPCN
jgi:hypothetical protein